MWSEARLIGNVSTVDPRTYVRPKQQFVLVLALIIAGMMISSGCTFNHDLTIAPQFETLPVTPKVPMTVGVYYSPEFITYKYSRIFGPHRYHVAVGKDSVAMFDKIADIAFDKVIRFDTFPPTPENNVAIDAVIVPDIESFHFRIGFEGDSPEYGYRYRMNIHAKDGMPVDTRVIIGKETPALSHFSVFDCIDDDLLDAAKKVLSEFQGLPALKIGGGALGSTSTSTVIPSGLIAKAESVASPLRLSENLSVPLAESRIVAVAVSLKNTSDRKLSVSALRARLVIPGGRMIAPSGVASIPARLEQRSYTGDVVGGLLGAPFGLLAIASEESEKNSARQRIVDALGSKAIGERVLLKDDVVEGILFFMPAETTPAFTTGEIAAWVIDHETKERFRVNISVSGLDFKQMVEQK